jgi:hypothetical protein
MVEKEVEPHSGFKAKGEDQGRGWAKGQTRACHSQKRQAERIESRKFFEGFEKKPLT